MESFMDASCSSWSQKGNKKKEDPWMSGQKMVVGERERERESGEDDAIIKKGNRIECEPLPFMVKV
jgi:hypothetical protein